MWMLNSINSEQKKNLVTKQEKGNVTDKETNFYTGYMTYYWFAFNLLGDCLVCEKIGQFEKDDILTSYEGGVSPLT